MIHQDLLDEAMEVACAVSGLPRMDKDALRRFPALADAIIVAYSNMRAARILMDQNDPPVVILPDPEPEPEKEPEPPPPPPDPEEVLIGAGGESITTGDGGGSDD